MKKFLITLMVLISSTVLAQTAYMCVPKPVSQASCPPGAIACNSEGKPTACIPGYGYDDNGNCTKCIGGTYSAGLFDKCKNCPDYTWSNPGASKCGAVKIRVAVGYGYSSSGLTGSHNKASKWVLQSLLTSSGSTSHCTSWTSCSCNCTESCSGCCYGFKPTCLNYTTNSYSGIYPSDVFNFSLGNWAMDLDFRSSHDANAITQVGRNDRLVLSKKRTEYVPCTSLRDNCYIKSADRDNGSRQIKIDSDGIPSSVYSLGWQNGQTSKIDYNTVTWDGDTRVPPPVLDDAK